MASASPSVSKELRVLIVATVVVFGLTIAGLFWARHVLGDDVRVALAAMDVRSLNEASLRYEPANRDAVRSKLQPGEDWRALSREDGDWLIAQFGPTLELNDDARDENESDALVDPWHRPFHIEVRSEADAVRFRFRSLGSDGKPDTADDVTLPEPASPATRPAP